MDRRCTLRLELLRRGLAAGSPAISTRRQLPPARFLSGLDVIEQCIWTCDRAAEVGLSEKTKRPESPGVFRGGAGAQALRRRRENRYPRKPKPTMSNAKVSGSGTG